MPAPTTGSAARAPRRSVANCSRKAASSSGLGGVGLLNLGLLEIGSSPGKSSVDRFENGAGGTWLVEIGGYAPGIEYDYLSVSNGDAMLAGTLEVEVIDAGGGLFEPQIGDSFPILEAPGTVVGTFANNPVSFVPGKIYLWSVASSADSVSLHLDDIVPCPADLSGDGMVDGADLGILLGAWGPCPGCPADLNFDNVVDGADLGILLAAWGPCPY